MAGLPWAGGMTKRLPKKQALSMGQNFLTFSVGRLLAPPQDSPRDPVNASGTGFRGGNPRSLTTQWVWCEQRQPGGWRPWEGPGLSPEELQSPSFSLRPCNPISRWGLLGSYLRSPPPLQDQGPGNSWRSVVRTPYFPRA